MTQTAVEWLQEIAKQREPDKFDWEQAKEMEKDQHFKSYRRGNLFLDEGTLDFKYYFEQYYKHTYEK